MSDNMEANLTVLDRVTFQSNVEVKQAKPRSRSDIENSALIEWKAKQREFSSCFKLCLINVARVISDKIDQNYIIGFYSPLKT